MVSVTQLLTYTSRVTVRIRNLPFLYTFEILCFTSITIAREPPSWIHVFLDPVFAIKQCKGKLRLLLSLLKQNMVEIPFIIKHRNL